MNAHHHNPFREASYGIAPRPVPLRIDELWRVTKGTFKNEAVVLFGSKAKPTSDKIPGQIVSPASTQAVTFHRIRRNRRSAWSENQALGANGTGFFNPAPFRQGADIMPRTLVFHSLARAFPLDSWNVSPISVTSRERYLTDGARTHKTFSMAVCGVSDLVVFNVLLSHHLTAFDIGAGANGILPISRDTTGQWKALSLTEIALMGTATAHTVRTILGALGTEATTQTYFDRFDTNRKKLTNQSWMDGWLVFMGAGGSNVCAAYAPSSRLKPDKTVIDQTLYWVEVTTEDEALYLTGLLNSASINQVIKEFQPRGQFGARHIHTLPLGVTPPFDSGNPAHAEVVATTRQLIIEWAAYKTTYAVEILDLLDPNKSQLHIRRKKIKEALATLPSWQNYEEACKAVYCIV